MTLAELHQLLTAVKSGLADGRAQVERATNLLDEARRALVDVQAKADPWLPPQYAQADEGFNQLLIRLATVDEFITGYQSRL